MTAVQLIPFSLHATLRKLTGLLTIAVPLVAGFQTTATILAIIVGTVVVCVGLASTPDEHGNVPLQVATAHALDRATVVALIAIAALVAIDGDPRAGVVLAAIGLVQLGGNLTTRYSLRA
jgi:hypothetical protein